MLKNFFRGVKDTAQNPTRHGCVDVGLSAAFLALAAGALITRDSGMLAATAIALPWGAGLIGEISDTGAEAALKR